MEIGKVGAFCFFDAMTAEESAAFCRRVERMGYKVLWTPEAWAREPFAHFGYLLGKTDRLIYATGIANIWFRDPITMASAARTLAEAADGRFILGIGVSHRSLVEDLHGGKYARPFSYMSAYIPRMKQALYPPVYCVKYGNLGGFITRKVDCAQCFHVTKVPKTEGLPLSCEKVLQSRPFGGP